MKAHLWEQARNIEDVEERVDDPLDELSPAEQAEVWRLRWQSVSEECDRLRKASEPPWLSDAAESLGEVRPEDGAPLALNWTQVLDAIHELREDRDHWKKRAEAAEFSLGASRDECAALRQNEAILAEQACPEGYLR